MFNPDPKNKTGLDFMNGEGIIEQGTDESEITATVDYSHINPSKDQSISKLGQISSKS